ncbi:MAG TPA: Ig-like domain-containing protein [Longimicrobium sp.]|jgi:hypothetical protein
MRFRAAPRLALLAFAAFAPAACDSPSGADPVVSALSPVAGAHQRGPAGYPLETPLTVLVADETGRPMAGQTVTFAVTAGGGTVDAASVVTGVDGRAATKWTLGTRVDTAQIVAATAGSGIRAQFTAESFVPGGVQAGPISGGGQTGVVGTEVAEPLVVMVRTRDGRPLQGVKVDWNSEGGTLTPVAERTDAHGLARARWVLPTVAGTRVATARLEGWLTTAFHATALSGPPARGEIVNPHARTDTVGRTLFEALVVRLWDRYENPASGVNVRWTAAEGSGTATPLDASWSGNGVSAARWTLGATVGTQRVHAEVPGLPTFTFEATAKIGPIARIAIDQRNLTVKHRTPFTMTASAYDVFGNRYPAGPELTSRLYWLSRDIHILSSSDSRSGVFNTPGYGWARVTASAVSGPAEDTVFVNVVP